MMQTLTIGSTKIPYEVRFSPKARLKRIVVTPGQVEVVAPKGTPLQGDDGVFGFVHTKRRWVFDAVREIAAKQGKLLKQHYQSGAKLQYRGRWLMLDVVDGDVDEVEISCRSKFHVVVPRALSGRSRLVAIQTAFDEWLRKKALRDVKSLSRGHSERLRVAPPAVCLSDDRHAWGKCLKDGRIKIHWRLIQAPKVALEYVVAHEMTHLLRRNHSPAFWKALGQAMPNWAEGKVLLERWEADHRAV